MVGSRHAGALLFLLALSGCGGATRTSGSAEGGDGGSASGGTGSGGSTGGEGGSSNTGGKESLTSLDVREFDQSCTVNADCYPVHDGDQCECDQCPSAAVNVGSGSTWVAAKSKLGCPRIGCNDVLCKPTAVACRNNRCVTEPAPNVVAKDYDRTCHEDADCIVVPAGQMCTGCDCDNAAAIGNLAYAKYASAVKDVTCAVPDRACGCESPPDAAVCVFFSAFATGECRLASEVGPTPGAQYAENYDQRCERDDDCRVVDQGQQCCMRCAAYSAVSFAALSTWESDLARIECPAGPKPSCAGANGPGACREPVPTAVCDRGRCSSVGPFPK